MKLFPAVASVFLLASFVGGILPAGPFDLDPAESIDSAVHQITAIAAGQVVNFALQKATGDPTIFSLTDPANYAKQLFEQEVDNGGLPPNPNITYYNTLRIDWNVPGALAVSILDAGSSFDGMAPVPLPAAAILFGTGLIGVLGVARRKLFALS